MTKLRELENNYIDLKGMFEWWISALMEEIPAWMQRELKSLEDKDIY